MIIAAIHSALITQGIRRTVGLKTKISSTATSAETILPSFIAPHSSKICGGKLDLFGSLGSSSACRNYGTRQKKIVDKPASKWTSHDVQVWARERFGDKENDVKILSEATPDFVDWICSGSTTWENLEEKLKKNGFESDIDLRYEGRHLKEEYQKMKKTMRGLQTMSKKISRECYYCDYWYLSRPDFMEASLHQFKPFPSFGKFMEGIPVRDHLFISEQLLHLWKRYINYAEYTDRCLYMVPLGPAGVGKSTLAALIAATAYFRKKPLFYYPDCRTLLTKEQAIKTFYMWNGDLLATDLGLQRAWDALLLDNYPVLSAFWTRFSKLPGAAMILDEHNAFYDKPVPILESFYTMFTPFQFVMFIGDKYERDMSYGYEDSVTPMQPLSDQELKQFVLSPNSWNKIPGHTVYEQFKNLQDTFGGLYGLLYWWLASGLTLEEARTELLLDYNVKIDRAYNSLSDLEKKAFIDDLKKLQSGKGVDNWLTASIHLNDSLLFCKKQFNPLVPISGTALEAIKLWLQSIMFHGKKTCVNVVP